MRATWHFREFMPGDNVSDPEFTKALFTRGSDGVLARGVVRESIQNSLDARRPRDGTARVRFCLRRGRMAARFSGAEVFLEGIWEHMAAKNAGLRSPPVRSAPIPFLVVEDFGTSGLTGDPAQWQPFGSERNPFFLFFRALGRSGKEGEDRGRWGVGKFVFPMASDGSSWFGYTVPSTGGGPALMGRVVLKTHGTSAKSFHPDGHWGLRSGDSSLVMPEVERSVLAAFRTLFALQRQEEPGLSVVVPWITEEISGESLLEAAIREYFLPILRRDLIVEIDDNGQRTVLDDGSLRAMVDDIQSELDRAYVSIGIAIADSDTGLTELGSRIRYDEMEWPETPFGEGDEQRLLHRLEEGELLNVRVPIEVKPKDERPRPTHFDVYMQRVEGLGRARPLLVREGITIPEDRTTALHGIASLVTIDDRPIAVLVGDSESPAHTELQYQLIKDKYTYAGKVLQLLRAASASIVKTLEHSSQEDDPFLLAQFFPVSTDDETRRGELETRRKKGASREPPPTGIPPGRAPRVRLARIDGGFRITEASDASEVLGEVTVRCAYDVRRGNPFKRYRPFDFTFSQADLGVDVEGAEITLREDDRFAFRPSGSKFECRVTGFDPNRNLIVKYEIE